LQEIASPAFPAKACHETILQEIVSLASPAKACHDVLLSLEALTAVNPKIA